MARNSDGHGRGRKSLPTVGGDIVRKPVYPTRDPQEEPVDAEWWEETEPIGNWQERTQPLFATRQQARQAQRAQERNNARLQARSLVLDEGGQQALLREEVRAAGEAYMKSLREAKILAPGFNDDERDTKLTMLQRVYVEQMVVAGLAPLRQGMNAQSLVSTLGAMSAMYLLSPNFQEMTKDKLGPLTNAVDQWSDQRAAARYDRAAKRTDRENHRLYEVNQLRVAEGQEPLPYRTPDEHLSDTVKQRLHDMSYRERGHREPYTARLAGLTEVALTEEAFSLLREPGADQSEIMTSYNSMIKRLYNQAELDGLRREEVTEAARVAYGERIMEDPRVQVMCSGFAHGARRMAPPEGQRLAGTDQTRRVWRGDFERFDGIPVDDTRVATREDGSVQIVGAFNLRRPMNALAHQQEMQEAMKITMLDAAHRGDLEAFNQDLSGYMMGCVASVAQMDGDGLAGNTPTRLYQSRTMLASMTVDGIPSETQRMLFSQAYVNALDHTQQLYPEFAQQWQSQYGVSWGEFTARVGTDPHSAYENWAADRDHQARPAPRPMRYSPKSPTEQGFDEPQP